MVSTPYAEVLAYSKGIFIQLTISSLRIVATYVEREIKKSHKFCAWDNIFDMFAFSDVPITKQQ